MDRTITRTARHHRHPGTVRLIAVLILTASLAAAAPAAPLTGMVTNKTTNKPAAGDTVVILNLSQGMQEGGRARTDARGHFTLDAGDGPHLIRVDHEKASYFHMAPPGTQSVEMDVYDVLANVPGLTNEADVIRIEADQQGLHVIENYFVKNDSQPPKTQFSDHAYEIYLPPDAQIEASAALSPGGMPVSSSPTPLADKGHYAFIFPIRPGETRFQLSYRLPYTGSYKFAPRVYMPTETVAVMLPKSMQFTPGPLSGYQPTNEDVNAQTFVVKNVLPSQPLDFTVSGLGSMPREEQGGDSANGGGAAAAGAGSDATAQGAPASAASNDTRPGGGLGTPIDTPDPLTKYKWWILGGLSLVLAVAAAFLLRRKPGIPNPAMTLAAPVMAASSPSLPVAATAPSANPLLAAMKDELFALETERLEGRISDDDYAQARAALEVVLRRALARQPS
jgi:hypothetical protein